MTREDGVPPEVSGFRLRPRPEVRDRVVLTPEAAGIKKSARGAVALLLADLARREHRHPEMRPQTSPRKDKSTALRATHSPTTARKGDIQGKGSGAPVKCLNRPLKAPPPGHILLIKFLAWVPSWGGLFSKDGTGKSASFFAGYIKGSVPPKTRHFDPFTHPGRRDFRVFLRRHDPDLQVPVLSYRTLPKSRFLPFQFY